MEVRTTFESKGIRSEKAVSAHLLLENAYESNLVSDIANVDYLAGHLGRTHLQPLAGLPTFVDDVFVFGYMRWEEFVATGRGSVVCTTGDKGSAKQVVARIAMAVRQSMGKSADGTNRDHIPTSIVHTIAASERASGSAIRATVARIEADTNRRAKQKWLELYPETEAAGLFVAKVDVSEIPMVELQAALPAFERQLLAHGYGLYSIDYTQDFSGVLDRKKLVEYLGELGFREQGDLAAAMEEEAPTILANTDSVGHHVCTWVCTSEAGYTTRTKIYDKVVSNFEAGEVREALGGHLVDYVDCPNQRLQQTFLHPDVQTQGCTRIEVSLYACRGRNLEAATAAKAVGEVLALVSPKDKQLFVVQPPPSRERTWPPVWTVVWC